MIQWMAVFKICHMTINPYMRNDLGRIYYLLCDVVSRRYVGRRISWWIQRSFASMWMISKFTLIQRLLGDPVFQSKNWHKGTRDTNCLCFVHLLATSGMVFIIYLVQCTTSIIIICLLRSNPSIGISMGRESWCLLVNGNGVGYKLSHWARWTISDQNGVFEQVERHSISSFVQGRSMVVLMLHYRVLCENRVLHSTYD